MSLLTLIKKLNSYFWFIFLPAHIFLIHSLYKIEFGLISVLLVFLLWTLIAGYGIGVGFHRLLSHKTFKTWPWAEAVVSYLGCLGIQGSPIFWVNLHRGYHHPHSDTEQDVQSPQKGRLWGYLWPIMIDYRELKYSFVNDLLRKNSQRLLHYRYFTIIWGTWVASFLISPVLFYTLIIAQLITLHQEFCVNLFCHTGKGYRNFEITDNSVNRYFFGIFFWGVGYHNNHHARPNSYNFAYSKYEFDPTTVLVRTIKKDS